MSARHRIAIIDDDCLVRKALCRLLRSVDQETDAYGSGEDFLRAVAAHRPDCIVLDLRMPDMTGLELQRRLIGIGLNLPTIIFTGHDEQGMQAECLAAGASFYLRKPLDEVMLLDAIEQAIGYASPLSG